MSDERQECDDAHHEMMNGPRVRQSLTASSCSARWILVDEDLPDQDEWVLHTYAGVRNPMYGRHHGAQFFEGNGPKSYPTTHWLPVPMISLPNKEEGSD